MQIIYKRLDEIKPYKNNPRKNEKAVLPVMESIKNFGFRVPIIIERWEKFTGNKAVKL